MNNMKLMAYIFLVVCFICVSACRKKISASAEIDPGTFTNNEYRNEFFGMSIFLPAGWDIRDMKELQVLDEKSKPSIAGDDKDLKAARAASEFQTVRLFAVFKYSLGSPVPVNPALMCLAERVRHVPTIKTGKDYHDKTMKILKASRLGLTFPGPVYTESFGDVDFDVLCSETSVGNITVKQNQYAAVIKGYVLLFTVTFATEEQEVELENIMDTLTFASVM